MKKYRIILCDLDDTFVNTKTAMKNVCFDIANDMKIVMDEDKYQNLLHFDTIFWKRYQNKEIIVPDNLVGAQARADYLRTLRFQEFFGDISFEDAALFNKRYETTLSHYQPLDGAKEIIEYLSSLDIELYIATNGPEELAIKKLDIVGISKYIKALYGYERIGYAKPSINFFEVLFKEIGNPDKEEVLMLGDSLHSDITGGANFGIDTCWYNPDNIPLSEGYTPTMTINNLLELKQKIK